VQQLTHYTWPLSRYLQPSAITGQQTMKTMAALARNWCAFFPMMSGYFKLFIRKCAKQSKKKGERTLHLLTVDKNGVLSVRLL
jgi:hypothetical protein